MSRKIKKSFHTSLLSVYTRYHVHRIPLAVRSTAPLVGWVKNEILSEVELALSIVQSIFYWLWRELHSRAAILFKTFFFITVVICFLAPLFVLYLYVIFIGISQNDELCRVMHPRLTGRLEV